jgi:hypothetical protein
MNYKVKNIIGKSTNLFCIYFFQIDTFISTYVLIIFYSIFYQLTNKTRNLLFAIQLLIYIIMVTGQLLRLSYAMSGGLLDIRHHFGCCIRYFFITLFLPIMLGAPKFWEQLSSTLLSSH